MGFLRQEYWSRLPFPPPGDLPDPEIEHISPALVGRFFTETLGKLIFMIKNNKTENRKYVLAELIQYCKV